MKVSSRLKRSVVLDDKSTLVVRCIRPSDRDALRAAFHALSPETRYRRFQAHFADLTPAMLSYLTEVDGQDHVALVATAGGRRRRGERVVLVGVARFIRLRSEPRSAEVAITVADALQGKGLGTRMLELLVEAAKERGIDTLVAHMLDGNVPIKRLLAQRGTLTRAGDGSVSVTIVQPRTATRFMRALAWLGWPGRAA
jgi:acetyltransferase